VCLRQRAGHQEVVVLRYEPDDRVPGELDEGLVHQEPRLRGDVEGREDRTPTAPSRSNWTTDPTNTGG
jgi:hypothetical protein